MTFEVQHTDAASDARAGLITTDHGQIQTPIFMPVGGIKEKILAAKRAGITDILMCKENEKDILEIPDMYLKGVTFHYVENVQDVWQFALTDQIVDNPLDFTIPEETEDEKKD